MGEYRYTCYRAGRGRLLFFSCSAVWYGITVCSLLQAGGRKQILVPTHSTPASPCLPLKLKYGVQACVQCSARCERESLPFCQHGWEPLLHHVIPCVSPNKIHPMSVPVPISGREEGVEREVRKRRRDEISVPAAGGAQRLLGRRAWKE